MITTTAKVNSVELFGGFIPVKPVFILISGRALAGKTTSANMIKNSLESKGFDRVIIGSFASELRKIAKERFGWDGNKDEKGRVLLQQLGAAGRNYNKDLWVNILLDSIFYKNGIPPSVIIIDDWRFPNEFDVINKLVESGLIHLITMRIKRTITEKIDLDPSETSLIDHDYYDVSVYNEGTLEELQISVNKIIEVFF